jgi:hypothetical protein
VAKPLGIEVHDHLIVGKDGHASLKGLHIFRQQHLRTGLRGSRTRGDIRFWPEAAGHLALDNVCDWGNGGRS